MKHGYLFLLLPFLTASCNSAKRAMSIHGPELFQHWTHSYEDDREGVVVYRPADYDFPPSRGREGFELKEDGTCIRYAIGPADGRQTMEGTWELKGKNELIVEIPGSSPSSFTLTILSATPETLTVRKP